MDVSDKALKRAELVTAMLGLCITIAWISYDQSSGWLGSVLRFSAVPAIGVALTYIHTRRPPGGVALLVVWVWAGLMVLTSLIGFASGGLFLLPAALLLCLAAAFGWIWDSASDS